MKRFNELNNSERWQIQSATSLRGMLQRAIEMDVQLNANDNIFSRKKVTFTHLIKMKNEHLIRDYAICVTPDGMNNMLSIEFNDGSILERTREIVFKL